MEEEAKLNSTNNWVHNNQELAEDELIIRELLDDESPFFLDLPNNHPSNNSNEPPQVITSINNTLISKVYSGPTILDIENALSSTQYHFQSQPRINSILERGYSKIENNKYTLKLKSCGNNGMADDGYKWRKYGQKSIKNSPFPRSYYRCTNPRCSAKKQVERSNEEEDTIIITYEGLHLHFAFPYLEQAQAQEQAQDQSQSPPMKKPRKMEAQSSESIIFSQPQGLLQDVVPLMVRNPSNSSSSSSNHASPPTSPSSLSWSSNNSSSCFDVGIDTTCLLGQ